MSNLKINASSLSALASRHAYSTAEDEIVKYLTRNNVNFQFYSKLALAKALGHSNPTQFAQEHSSLEEVAKPLTKEIEKKFKPRSLADSLDQEAFRKLIDSYPCHPSVKKHVIDKYYMIRGTILEDKTVLALKLAGYHIHGSQRAFTYPFELTLDGNPIIVNISGRIDGIFYQEGKEYSVCEIKNRIKGFKLPIPEYEYDQLAIYSAMTKLELTHLVQMYQNDICITGFRPKNRLEEILKSKELSDSIQTILYYTENPQSQESQAFAEKYFQVPYAYGTL